MSRLKTLSQLFFLLAVTAPVNGQAVIEMRVPVEGQPLAANISRVLQTLEFLGAPLPGERQSPWNQFRNFCAVTRVSDLL